jgi:hypothetical protein
MAADEPGGRRIAVEILLYALLVLLVGGAFVALRASREGERVLNYDTRSTR